MKKLTSHCIGVDDGEVVLFSDFQDEGDMWTGTGPRERRRHVAFSEPYLSPPTVHCTLSMWDMDNGTNLRGDIQAENVTCEGFDAVFKTWGDSRIARARARWMAIGALRAADDWEV
ncbi:H-type lectin domain-containing protein [Oceanicola sp. S124]|uniref:H-type lectin domain-containing protein n=1 Tax=Oceanicola sp. S124 TaxID=1042378 RepID=UPI000255A9E9|nr:H-type lectin domain-containing protein [Oceanicola sp. S124]